MTGGFFSRIRVAIVLLGMTGVVAAAVLPGVVSGRMDNRASAATAIRMVMTATGAKQGPFRGDDTAAKSAANSITLTAVQVEATTATTTAGQVGKMQVKPVVVTHVMGGSSPQFLTAQMNNEQLTTVVVSFSRIDPNGRDTVYYRLTLNNATVVDIKQYSAGGEMLEDVSLRPQRMAEEAVPVGTHVTIDLGKI